MRQQTIDFTKIHQAISYSIEALREDQQPSESALNNLLSAQEEVQQAMSFSLSTHK